LGGAARFTYYRTAADARRLRPAVERETLRLQEEALPHRRTVRILPRVVEQSVPIPPAKSEKLYLAVADRLKALIRDGRYTVGDPLPGERELSQSLRVTLAAVREALVALEILGIVDRGAGHGWTVQRPADAWLDVANVAGRSPSDILQARLLVECAAVERVALQHDADDLRDLHRTVDSFAGEVERREYHGKADREFHIRLARGSGNFVFGDLVAYLWDLQNAEFFQRVERMAGQERARIERYVADHRRIFNAVASLDGPRAREEMRRHLEGVYQDLLGG
jgi:DNA-binding FadR family transcriptional regulator